MRPTSWICCADLTAELARGLEDRPPPTVADGGVIRAGYDSELDQLRSLRDGGRQYIASLQQRERDRTGIPSLKVGFNKVFGYYLEITNAHAAKVPGRLRAATDAGQRGAIRHARAQGLRGARARRGGADRRAREAELFGALRGAVGAAIARIQRTARVLARLDVWAALAEGAVLDRYVRPTVHAGYDLVLRESRHPVIERMMPRESFIPNDARFTEAERVALVTGPNMAGKSTILRQIGLCVVLAQIGAFVPAAEASIGVVDRLFTRVGASDNLAQGQSTFMVEMSETSAILHNAGARSLVLLDEIGRGTSTYDGVAIAWAVTEHLHDRVGCKTMFATHYHELMQLPERLAARPQLQRRGPGDRRHGRVPPSARAGRERTARTESTWPSSPVCPPAVVRRASEILGTLEGEHRMVPGQPPASRDPGQLALFARRRAAASPHGRAAGDRPQRA